MEEFDIAVTARMRHGELWKLVERFGSQAAAARELGVSLQEFNGWVNMRTAPSFTTERLREVERKLVQLTGKTAEDIWPELVKSEDWLDLEKTATAHRLVDMRRLADETERRLTLPSPIDAAIEAETRELLATKIKSALNKLTFREREIIKLRFGLGGDGLTYTLEEVGHIFKVARERIREIEAKAIRKLQAEMPVDTEMAKSLLTRD